MKRKLVALILAIAGCSCIFQGSYIYAKALVAQVLLRRAWDEAKDGAERARPWPWADTWPVARLVSPQHHVDLIVLAGATGSTTAFGPGHVPSSAPPGYGGHLVLAAHRDTHFAFLEHVAPGDVLWLESTHGAARRYVVSGARVVDQADTRALETPGDTLSLVTCYPFDAQVPGGPLRYVVEAQGI